MTTQNETYLGDGLYAKYDGFAVWLRAPREHGDHVVALEPHVFHNFFSYALTIPRLATIIRKSFGERPEPAPNYDTTAERNMDLKHDHLGRKE